MEFIDSRPAAARLAEQQHLANISYRVTQLREIARLADGTAVQLQKNPNNTGLPDQLKLGIESLSGLSMDHVKVHYNSARPAQFQAHAYAQGDEIHLGPGQESHLPHEVWHVVQQAQGRVRPTARMNGGSLINNDAKLESEADLMGAHASRHTKSNEKKDGEFFRGGTSVAEVVPSHDVMQCKLTIGADEDADVFESPHGKKTDELLREMVLHDDSDLWKRGWKTAVRSMVKEGDYRFETFDDLIKYVGLRFKRKDDEDDDPTEIKRPGFSSSTYELAKATESTYQERDMSWVSLLDEGLAVPHRMSFADLRNSLLLFLNGSESITDLVRWTDRLLQATRERKELNLQSQNHSLLPRNYRILINKQLEEFVNFRTAIIKNWSPNSSFLNPKHREQVRKFMSALNGIHGNVPDLGPSTPNIKVSSRLHPNFLENGAPTPGTKAALAMSPHRIKQGVASTSDGRYLVTPRGERVDISKVNTGPHKASKTTIHPYELLPKRLFVDSDDESESESDD
jgi:hypothetical protein